MNAAKASKARGRDTLPLAQQDAFVRGPPHNVATPSPQPCRGRRCMTPLPPKRRRCPPMNRANGAPRFKLNGHGPPARRDHGQLRPPNHRGHLTSQWTTSPSAWTMPTRLATLLWNRHTLCHRPASPEPSPSWTPRPGPYLCPLIGTHLHSPRPGPPTMLESRRFTSSPHPGPRHLPRPSQVTPLRPPGDHRPDPPATRRTTTFLFLQATHPPHGP